MATIFEETAINGMVMNNRMIRSATWEGMCEQDGRPTEKLINCYRDLAQGGIGLIISGLTFVLPEGICVTRRKSVLPRHNGYPYR
jgi:2,4-dienoyl-CoA reductase-like NADH-dependent reductase (Old Yellow Enzyme family)